jgi:hypothetical protein
MLEVVAGIHKWLRRTNGSRAQVLGRNEIWHDQQDIDQTWPGLGMAPMYSGYPVLAIETPRPLFFPTGVFSDRSHRSLGLLGWQFSRELSVGVMEKGVLHPAIRRVRSP